MSSGLESFESSYRQFNGVVEDPFADCRFLHLSIATRHGASGMTSLELFDSNSPADQHGAEATLLEKLLGRKIHKVDGVPFLYSTNGVTDQFVARVASQMHALPAAIKNILAAEDGKVVLTTDLGQMFPWRRFLTPDGYSKGSTIKDVPGGYHHFAERVLLAEDNLHSDFGLAVVLRHEIGHFINRSLGGAFSFFSDGFSDSESFRRAYNDDVAQLNRSTEILPPVVEYYLRKSEGAKETFAQIFAELTLPPEHKEELLSLRKYFPRTFGIVENRVKPLIEPS